MTRFLVASLIVYRITALLVRDDGPYDCLLLWRAFVSRYSRVLECYRCASVWVGTFAALDVHGLSWSSIVLGLSYSAVAILIDAVVEYCRVQTAVMGG